MKPKLNSAVRLHCVEASRPRRQVVFLDKPFLNFTVSQSNTKKIKGNKKKFSVGENLDKSISLSPKVFLSWPSLGEPPILIAFFHMKTVVEI